MLCPTKSDGSYGHLACVNLAKKAGKARFRRPNQLNSDEHRDKAILGAALGLAERDHETVKPIVDLIRASSKFIGPESDPRTIRNAYRCDITYAPGYPFGFDYLKDQIKLREFEELTLGRDVLESIHGHNIEDKWTWTMKRSVSMLR